jgi:CheY-like chemotaxis protein
MTHVNRRIVCVDDEPNVLEGLERTLGFDFDVYTATSGLDALQMLENEGEFAVVISDMRMPRMDGATFLQKVRDGYPDTVRILLTGHAEFEAAIRAVNEGQIFRFLTKPCPAPALTATVESAIEQFRLLRAERVLLEQTLQGAVSMLTEILSLVQPATYSRANRIKAYVSHMATELGVADVWRFEIAAMLSQVGCVTLSDELLGAVYSGTALDEEQTRQFAGHPEAARQLLAKIPRLEQVAEMVALQNTPAAELASESDVEDVILGAQMLKVAHDFDNLVVTRAMGRQDALSKLRAAPKTYAVKAVDALAGADVKRGSRKSVMMTAKELQPAMVLDEDIVTKTDVLVVAQGQEVSLAVLTRLRAIAKRGVLKEPFRVLI